MKLVCCNCGKLYDPEKRKTIAVGRDNENGNDFEIKYLFSTGTRIFKLCDACMSVAVWMHGVHYQKFYKFVKEPFHMMYEDKA